MAANAEGGQLPTMPIEDLPYVEEEYLNREQQAVTFEVPNPDHERYAEPYEPEMMRDFYEGSKWSVNTLGKDRNAIVGHLMVALQDSHEYGDDTALIRLFKQLASRETQRKVEQVEEME